MKNFLTNIRADKLTFRGFNMSALLAIVATVFALIYYKNLPPFIPVFNQLPWGTQRLTESWGIFIPIILFIFIFIFNIIFTSIIYPKNPLIARIVSATTLLLSVLNFLFIIRIIFVIL